MKYLSNILLGVLLAFSIDVLTMCKKDSGSPTEPAGNPNNVTEIQDLEDDAEKTVNAFKSGDISEINKVISDEASTIYGNDLDKVKNKFDSFSEALKNKKLIASSDFYAEYEITVNGETYIVAFAKKSENGDWKLARF